MGNPTQGLSAGPLLLAVVALVAATASIGLAARKSGGPSEPVPASHAAPRKAEARAGVPAYRRVEGPKRTLAPAGDPTGRDIGSSSALCPSGMRAVSGGFQTITGGGETFYSDALTDGRVGWGVGAVNNLAVQGTVQAFAYCMRSGEAVDVGDRRTLARRRSAARREMQVLVGRYRSTRSSQL
jgi:hypothetical protein